MASGTIYGTCVANNGASSRYEYKLEWTATPNTSSNSSSVRVTAYVRANNSTYGTSTNWTSKIEGSTVKTFNSYIGQSGSGTNWVNFGSKSFTVNHNSDGTKSYNIDGSFSGTYNGAYALRSGAASKTVTFDTIPRTSSFSMSTTDMTLGSTSCTITISKASSSFTHKVYYRYGTIERQLYSGSGTTVTFIPPIGDSNQTSNSTKGTGTIVVETYSGSTKVGTKSQTFTNHVPSSVLPNISMNLSGTNIMWSKYYLAGRTQAQVSVDSESGAYGSSIRSRLISGTGLSTTSTSGFSSKLSAGTHTYKIEVTDSRGRKKSTTKSITVQSYSNPWISNVRAQRVNSGGNPSDSGTTMKVYWDYGITNVASANFNGKQYQVQVHDGSSWSVKIPWRDFTGGYHQAPAVTTVPGSYAVDKSYTVKVEVRDSLVAVSGTATLGTSNVVMNIEKDGIGIGKYHERGALDVGGNLHTSGQVRSVGGLVCGNNAALNSSAAGTPAGFSAATVSADVNGAKYSYSTILNVKADTDYARQFQINIPNTGTGLAFRASHHNNSGGTGQYWSAWKEVEVKGENKICSKYYVKNWGDHSGNAPWYGLGLLDYNLSGGSSSGVQVSGYHGLRLQAAGSNIELYQGHWMRLYTATNASSGGVRFQGTNVMGRIWPGSSGFVIQSEAGANLHIGKENSTDLVISSHEAIWRKALYNIRDSYNFVARSSSANGLTQFRLERSDGTYTGYVGMPNDNRNLHLVTAYGQKMVISRGDGGFYVKDTNDSAYRTCYASKFQVSSERKWKSDIKPLSDTGLSALDMIKATTIYEYQKTDGSTKSIEIGIIIDDETAPAAMISSVEYTPLTEEELKNERGDATIDESNAEDERTPAMMTRESEDRKHVPIVPKGVPQIDRFVDLYSMGSIAWKGIQELLSKVLGLETRMSKVEQENQQLKEELALIKQHLGLS